MKFFRFHNSIVTILIPLVTCINAFSQKTTALKIESGVSQSLANYRRKILDNVEYTLTFIIPAEKVTKITGVAYISFNFKKSSSPLQIDFKQDADHVKNVSVNGKSITTEFKNEHIVINDGYLVSGKNTVLITFTAGDLSLNRNNDFLYTLLVPDRARTVFPCFDQPDIKARYQLNLTVPRAWEALTNSALVDTIMLPVGSKTYVFKLSDPFSTYLFSFVAGKFKTVNKQMDQWPMNFYFRETDSIKIRLSVDTIFGWHRKALHFLEDYTQIKFPFQKLDFVAVPDFQYGGMEHVGAIDYRASTLFLDSGATKEQENGRGSLVAHETSHMWFGDLVTMKWFNDVWMKEVFANFMADKITQGDQASNNYELRFLLGHFPRAYSIDRTAGANPIRQELPNLQEAGSLYGPIIYDKAPVMMRQLERLMGEDAFRQGLRIYLKKYSFANATWPDLIHILDSLTPADLQAWNKVWVNTPGRPLFTYSLRQENSRIKKLTISQKGETSANYFLPQFFEIALVYSDHFEEIKVNMNKPVVELKEVDGKPIPEYILFNSSGQGYGVFPIDKNSNQFYRLTNPLMRASAYINLYESMLGGNNISPSEFLTDLLQQIDKQNEPEELILGVMTNYISDIYWRLITPGKRNMIEKETEDILWKAMQKESVASKKKILFRTFQNIALSKNGLDTLYAIWKNQKPPTGVRLSDDEYISIAQNLAIRKYPDENILQTQLQRISNPDRKQRFEFLMPVLSNDVQQWDRFFASLKDPATRKKESWVGEALGYLHHPLRQDTSIKYLRQTLEMLEDVQKTGDIFFPAAWLSSSFGSYQSRQAADIVRDFLKAHPHYNPQLKMKILQAADPVFRAEKLVK